MGGVENVSVWKKKKEQKEIQKLYKLKSATGWKTGVYAGSQFNAMTPFPNRHLHRLKYVTSKNKNEMAEKCFNHDHTIQVAWIYKWVYSKCI